MFFNSAFYALCEVIQTVNLNDYIYYLAVLPFLSGMLCIIRWLLCWCPSLFFPVKDEEATEYVDALVKLLAKKST